MPEAAIATLQLFHDNQLSTKLSPAHSAQFTCFIGIPLGHFNANNLVWAIENIDFFPV